MKMIIDSNILKDAVKTVSKAIMPNSPVPAMNSILTEPAGEKQLRLTGTSGTMTIKKVIEAEDPEKVLIDAKMLNNIATVVAGDVEFSKVDNTFWDINAGTAKFRLNTIPVKEWPSLADVDQEKAVTMAFTPKMLEDIKTGVLYAASTNEAKAVLTGVNIHVTGNKAIVAATDSYRMATKEIDLKDTYSDEISVVIPATAMKTAAALFKDEESEVTVKVDGKRISLSAGDTELSSALLEGQYPDLARLYPTQFEQTITVNREILLAVLKRAKLLSNDDSPLVVTLTADRNDTATISIRNGEIGSFEEDIPIKREGAGDFKICYMLAYLLDAVTSIEADDLRIDFSGTTKPALITGDGTTKAVILPVRSFY